MFEIYRSDFECIFIYYLDTIIFSICFNFIKIEVVRIVFGKEYIYLFNLYSINLILTSVYLV